MQPAATILIVKSGISNHAASGILDELCLSKFGTFHGGCPQPADNFTDFLAARLVLLGCPPIVCELPDTLRGLSKRGKTQHLMPDAARKNYLDFTPKNSPLPVTLERYGSLIFCLQLISCTLSRLPGLSNTALPF